MRSDATESSIRKALLHFLSQRGDASCVFLSELFIDGLTRRADLVVANGNLVAFEIKSASDKLTRLEGQLEAYKKSFEATTIVCAHKHLSNVRKLAPSGVGILVVSEDGGFLEIRRSKLGKIKKQAWIQYLPVAEIKSFLRLNDVRVSRSSGRSDLVRECERLPYLLIRDYALEYIKGRDARNAVLKERSDKNKKLRSIGSESPYAVKDWLEQFSMLEPMQPIPRKIL